MQAEKPPNSTLQISSLLFLLFSVKVKVHFTGSESWIGVEYLKGKGTKCTHFIFLFLAAHLALPTLCQVEIRQQYNLYGFGFTFFSSEFLDRGSLDCSFGWFFLQGRSCIWQRRREGTTICWWCWWCILANGPAVFSSYFSPWIMDMLWNWQIQRLKWAIQVS